MTRIFEALRKAQTSRAQTAEDAPARVAPVLPAVPTDASRRPAVQAVPRPAAPGPHLMSGAAPAAAPACVRFAGTPDLTEDIVREMTALRMNLEASLTERAPRVIMLMSAVPGEGTTTVATQFAAALGRDERLRVLLVDLNARRPTLSAMADDASDGVGPIMLMPLTGLAGGGVVSAAAARDQVGAVAEDYDWVVLDGPPALESPDAAQLAAIADGVVMIVEAGRTKEPVLARAVDMIRKAGSNLVGSVLNRRRLEIPDFIYRRI